MEQPLGVFESIDRRHRTTKFALLGVPVSFTKGAALSWPIMALSALPLAWLETTLRGKGHPLARTAQLATIFSATNAAHSLGHIVAGRAVGAPMDELIVTATRQVNHYSGEQEGLPTTTHLARAAGGPLGNGAVALLLALLWLLLGKRGSLLRDAALANLGSALLALLPLDSVDGGDILKRLRELTA